MDYLDLRQEGGEYVEAIKDGEIIRVSEKLAILEDLFILRKINNVQQQNVLPSSTPQLHTKISREQIKTGSIMSEWKHGKFGVKKNNALQDLIPNFNWEVSRNRKLKNMPRLKLAQLINATEQDVKMIELGELPSDDFVLISRIEQVFGINLRKNPGSIAQVSLADLQKRDEGKKKDIGKNIFKDSLKFSGNEIEIID